MFHSGGPRPGAMAGGRIGSLQMGEDGAHGDGFDDEGDDAHPGGAKRARQRKDFADDPNLPGEMRTTIALKSVFCGTDVSIVHLGIPPQIPAEACSLGWQESLTLLAQWVEAEIPG